MEKSAYTPDTFLVTQAKKGREDAFQELVGRHRPALARLVARVTRRPELVDDLTQEIFILAYQNLAQFEARASFRTWLYRIAVNASLRELQKEQARERMRRAYGEEAALPDSLIVPWGAMGERLVLRREVQAAVRQALDQLDPEHSAVLVLRYLEELNSSEIAEVLQIPAGTVRSRLYHARIQLAEILAPVLAEPQSPAKEDTNHEV
jgi:RNA polymerase sigma-70 factor (ECF subfamily)